MCVRENTLRRERDKELMGVFLLIKVQYRAHSCIQITHIVGHV